MGVRRSEVGNRPCRGAVVPHLNYQLELELPHSSHHSKLLMGAGMHKQVLTNF